MNYSVNLKYKKLKLKRKLKKKTTTNKVGSDEQFAIICIVSVM